MTKSYQLNDSNIIKAIKISARDHRERYQAATWQISLRMADMVPQCSIPTRVIRKYMRDMERRGLLISVYQGRNTIVWTLIEGDK